MERKLQRHSYTITYRVTSASSPALRRVSSLRYLLIFLKTNKVKFFWALSPGPRGSRSRFPIPLLALSTLGFIPAFPPLFTPTAKRWNLTSNVTPTLKWSGVYRVTNLCSVHRTRPLSFTQPSTSPPPSPLHIQQVEPNPQRHPYTTTSMLPYAKMCARS